MFDWEHGIALQTLQGILALTTADWVTHGISRVAAGTWDIFASYCRDGRLKLDLVQRSQDSCLVRTDTSGS